MAGYDSVRVACRFRPPNQREKSERNRGSDIVIDILDCNKQVKYYGNNKKTHIFTFDRAFQPTATQEEVFIHTGGLLVDGVLQGINCTLFAYGQTGSGKTHTMEGQIGSLLNEGLIPRMVRKLFHNISSMVEDVKYALRVSYVEIYNEKLRDLLDPSLTPRVRGGALGANKSIVIENSHEQYVSSPEQVFELLYAGQSNRSVSSTKMNSASSRSHAVFMLYIEREESNGNKKKSKLLMVDLAGSEKVKKTEAKGAILEEAKNINQSLSTLGNVINALTKGQLHVPYRDSILTRLLSDALGGNSKTMLIIAASPCHFNSEETLSTLRFGKRAKEIKNKVAVNEELSIEQYKARLHAAKLKISKLEQENTVLKKKVRQMMVISTKSSDKQLLNKFESLVKNIDLKANKATTPRRKGPVPIHTKGCKKHKNKRHKSSSLTRSSNKKQNKRLNRSMSVQISAESLVGLQMEHDIANDEEEYLLNASDNSLEKDAEILSLKAKLSEIEEELNRAENAERMITDAKSELYEGHLQLREEYIELSDKFATMELVNDASQSKIDALQTLLNDSKLRQTQKQQEFICKEKIYIAKCQKLETEISMLKKTNINRGLIHSIRRAAGNPKNKKEDDNKMDTNNNAANITEMSSKLVFESGDNRKKHEWQQFVNKTKEQHEKHKLLQNRYKKMSEILNCYKERDETNYALRKAWAKHINALEKALCQQDAATLRWREQTKTHQQILKTEVDRLRNNIKHFQQYKRYGYSYAASHASSPSAPITNTNQNININNNEQLQNDNTSVTSAPSYALQQAQIIQSAPQQFVQSYSQPTYIHSGGGARLANPTYVIPNYRLIQQPMQAIPQTVNFIPTQMSHQPPPHHQIRTAHHPTPTYLTSSAQHQHIQQQHIQQPQPHQYNLDLQ